MATPTLWMARHQLSSTILNPGLAAELRVSWRWCLSLNLATSRAEAAATRRCPRAVRWPGPQPPILRATAKRTMTTSRRNEAQPKAREV